MNGDNQFVEILRPFSATEFLASYWESRALVISGHAQKFERFNFDFDRFIGALERMPTGTVRANEQLAKGEGRYLSIEAREAHGCFDAGMTICVTGIDQEVGELSSLCSDTREAMSLSGAVSCNCYVSPEAAGFGLHFDRQSVFLLQIEGCKDWRFATRPSVEFPPEAIDGVPESRRHDFRKRHPRTTLEEPDCANWSQHTLTPGDILYLPPGTWHYGRAGRYSLGITLTCATYGFSGLLIALLEERLFGELPWRRNMPATQEQTVSPAFARTVDSFVAERLTELRSFVANLEPQDFANLWCSRLGRSSKP